jgi:Ca2+-binding RTX toxin-like protein
MSNNQSSNVIMQDNDSVVTYDRLSVNVTEVKMNGNNDSLDVDSNNVTIYESGGSGSINLEPAIATDPTLLNVTIYGGTGQYTINNPNNEPYTFVPYQPPSITYYQMVPNQSWKLLSPDGGAYESSIGVNAVNNLATDVQMTSGDNVTTLSEEPYGPDITNIKMGDGQETVNVNSDNVTIYEGSGTGNINLDNFAGATYDGTPISNITIYGGTGQYTINNPNNEPFNYIPPKPEPQESYNFNLSDQTTAQQWVTSGNPYTGPVADVTNEFIQITSDNLNVTCNAPNEYVKLGSGEDAIQAQNGTNVLDGGSGSNFLTGGTGFDTFFNDARNAAIPTWDTINNVNPGSGDNITIWVNSLNNLGFNWQDNQGVVGYTGLTLSVTQPNQPEATVTLAGWDSSSLNNGALSFTQGSVEGNNYLLIHVN